MSGLKTREKWEAPEMERGPGELIAGEGLGGQVHVASARVRRGRQFHVPVLAFDVEIGRTVLWSDLAKWIHFTHIHTHTHAHTHNTV